MTATFLIQPNVLAALRVFEAKGDVREHLNGILLEVRRNQAFAVASDGRRLLAARIRVEPETVDSQEVVVPGSLLNQIKVPARQTTPVHFHVTERQNRPAEITLEPQPGNRVTGDAVDSRYPRWRRVVPKTCSDEPAHFNPTFVGDLAKVAKVLGLNPAKGQVSIGYNGPKACALIGFQGRDDLIGAIAPLIPDHCPNTPDWAREAA